MPLGPAVEPPTGHLTLRDRMQGEDIGDGWIVHTLPHKNSTYYYHRDLKLVTSEDLKIPETRRTFLSNHQKQAGANRVLELETVVIDNMVYAVNHNTETWNNQVTSDQSRANYWIYLSNFPCHHDLPDYAESEALTMLQLMIVQDLTNSKGVACTPFSMPDIKRYIDFINFSKTLKDAVPSAKCVIISNIIANFYESRVPNATSTEDAGTDSEISWLKMFVTIARWGMPPNYLPRFDTAYNIYGQTLQPDAWKSFLDVVRRERAAANVLSGLVLAPFSLRSSVAFLAIQALVDVAQFFIIISIGLSLGSVVMGFNGGFDEKLYQLQYIEPPTRSRRDLRVAVMGRAMEQHYTMLLLSVLCFYLALLAFTAYSVYASVFVVKSFTVRYAFYVMATGGLLITMGIILHWNWRFSQQWYGCFDRAWGADGGSNRWNIGFTYLNMRHIL